SLEPLLLPLFSGLEPLLRPLLPRLKPLLLPLLPSLELRLPAEGGPVGAHGRGPRAGRGRYALATGPVGPLALVPQPRTAVAVVHIDAGARIIIIAVPAEGIAEAAIIAGIGAVAAVRTITVAVIRTAVAVTAVAVIAVTTVAETEADVAVGAAAKRERACRCQ